MEQAIAHLSEKTQTVGVLSRDDGQRREWVKGLTESDVSRIVPINLMHQFGLVWDGYEFWRRFFTAVEVG